jgi:hypothetical protein
MRKQMDDMTKSYDIQQLLYDAAQYRLLRRVFDADRWRKSPVANQTKDDFEPKRQKDAE